MGDRVLIRVLNKEEVTKSGLFIPESSREKPQEGEIVAVGAGKLTEDGRLLPMDVKVGDKVLFGKYAGTELKVKDETLLIMHQDDILAIIEGE